ncbi:FecR family protein [Rugamonas sp. DEMB1]|uniref:FecR family protein n=1 Tax=Rugamonas sp. DEMB1 TaxID=3039386 RepID=UPI002449CA01|nr:FecR family protein [Rugamonas sp. DEMB1]WGG51382.1 FecR family protein [Rugamonas sp. DEMB1]
MLSQNSPLFPSVRRAAIAGLGAVLLAGAGAALADEAGRIVFVSGEVRNGARATVVGDAVQEGEELSTGKDGYVYLKTSDDGLLILRPSSRARIAAYHVDRANPANTRVKLELLSGVARSVSGSAVKQARQNFRFNTPVAAIGVRGTDFTVFTDQETSNVTVLSGAIVVSGFSGGCQASGIGPCEHPSSRELAGGQNGQMLQVRRGQATPQLLSGGVGAPDTLAPPRGDEPSGKGGQALGEPGLDAQKSNSLLQQAKNVRSNEVAPTPEPPNVAPANPVVVAPVVPPPAEMVWGRWVAVLDQAPAVDMLALGSNGSKRLVSNAYYVIGRTKGGDWEVPQQGNIGFVLRASEAVVIDNATLAQSPASVQNGQLQIDFGKRTFSTGFDLLTGKETFKQQSTGTVGAGGELSGGAWFMQPNNMTVNGVVGPNNSAAYIFSSRLDEKRSGGGITVWGKEPAK